MELLGGMPLSQLLRAAAPLSPSRAIRILRQVAEALSVAHDAGIIHRDLKPDNIQISDAGGDREIVKVLDFGLAKVAGASQLTRAGIVFGTPHYMSPEQAAGDPLDRRVDVYSLGIVTYEMLTGRVPFEADSFMGVLTKHLYSPPQPPSEVVGEHQDLGMLEEITLRCLQKRPDDRYASMGELLQHLERASTAVSDATPVGSEAGLAPSTLSSLGAGAASAEVAIAAPKRSALVGGLVAAIALAAAAGLGWWLLADDAESASTMPAPTPAQPASERSRSPAAADEPRGLSPAPLASGSATAPATRAAASAAVEDSMAPTTRSTKQSRRARSGSDGAAKTEPPRSKSPPKTPRIGGSEIVDPWEN
jgi:serine/threonine-protein kinase